jgi:hypothetical protein
MLWEIPRTKMRARVGEALPRALTKHKSSTNLDHTKMFHPLSRRAGGLIRKVDDGAVTWFMFDHFTPAFQTTSAHFAAAAAAAPDV